MYNGASDSFDLNEDGGAVGDAGGCCWTCTIGFATLFVLDCMTVLIGCLKETGLLETETTGTGECLVCI